MASIGHIATGALVGAVYAKTTNTKPLPAVAAFAALAVAPDLDLLAIPFGVRGTPLEHRVLSHSWLFAGVLGLAVGLLAWRKPFRMLTGAMVFLAVGSHGMLDALTKHGRGPALLWPLSDTRYSFAWQPIRGSESFEGYFNLSALPAVATEVLIFLPVMVLTGVLLLRSREPVAAPNPPAEHRRQESNLRPLPAED